MPVCGSGFGSLALQGVGPSKAEMGECADGFVQNNATVAQNFLELGCGFAAPMRGQIGFSMHIHGIHRGCERTVARCPKLVRSSAVNGIYGLRKIVAAEHKLSVNLWQLV